MEETRLGPYAGLFPAGEWLGIPEMPSPGRFQIASPYALAWARDRGIWLLPGGLPKGPGREARKTPPHAWMRAGRAGPGRGTRLASEPTCPARARPARRGGRPGTEATGGTLPPTQTLSGMDARCGAERSLSPPSAATGRGDGAPRYSARSAPATRPAESPGLARADSAGTRWRA